MEEYESTWSEWSAELPAELQERQRLVEFYERTTPSSISNYFIVTKTYLYFEMQWDSKNYHWRWLEIDQEECKRRTNHVAGYYGDEWYAAFPGLFGLVINPVALCVGRVGYEPTVTLTQFQFELFRSMYDAGEKGAGKDAVENAYEGAKTAMRQRKAELRNNLIPLDVTVGRGWRIEKLDQNAI